MKCSNCNNDGSQTAFDGMSGAPANNQIPLCDSHYAQHVFDHMDETDEVGVGGGLLFLPVIAVPNESETWHETEPQIRHGFVMNNEGVEVAERIEREIANELNDNADFGFGEVCGFVLVDVEATGESVMNFGALPDWRDTNAQRKVA